MELNKIIDEHYRKVNIALFFSFLIINIYTIIEELYLTVAMNYLQIALIIMLLASLRHKDMEYKDKELITMIFVFANIIQIIIIFMLKNMN